MPRTTPAPVGTGGRATWPTVLAGAAVLAAGALAAGLAAGSVLQQVGVGFAVAVLAAAACIVTASPLRRDRRRLQRRDRALGAFTTAAGDAPVVEEALAAAVEQLLPDAALVGLHLADRPTSDQSLEGVVVADALSTGLPATVPDGTTGRETARLLALPVATAGRRIGAVVLRVGDVSEQDVADIQHLLTRIGAALGDTHHEPPPPPPPAATAAPPAPEQDDRGLQELVARGAHDLRTPLNTLTGMVETLVRHGDQLSSGERDELHAALQRATRRIAAWITALLDAAVDEDPGPSRVESCHLQPLLEEAVMVSSAATAGLEVYVAPTDLQVDADPGAVVRIVGNLLTNAGHHAGSGDTVEVEARPLGDRVEVSVRDHGVGWDGGPPSGDGRTGRSANHHTGLGLGLASVRAHVAAWGGQLELDETPGGGATVRFTLPRGDRRPTQPDEAEPDLRWTIAGRESHVRGAVRGTVGGVHRTP